MSRRVQFWWGYGLGFHNWQHGEVGHHEWYWGRPRWFRIGYWVGSRIAPLYKK